MSIQTQPAPAPRKDWNYDQYFLARLNQNKKQEPEKTNPPEQNH